MVVIRDSREPESEVRIEEVRLRRKSLALSSPRSPFLGGLRFSDDPGIREIGELRTDFEPYRGSEPGEAVGGPLF